VPCREACRRMLNNRGVTGVGFAMPAPAEQDMSDSFAVPCALIGGHGIVRCTERQMCSLACQSPPALPGIHAPDTLQHAGQLQCISSPNNKSAMGKTARAVTHSSWPTASHPPACSVHSSRCKCPRRKHGKQSLREDMKRLQMVPQSLTLTQSPHGSPLWA